MFKWVNVEATFLELSISWALLLDMKIQCPKNGNTALKCPWSPRDGSVRDMPTTGVMECASCKLVTHQEDLSNLVNYVDGSMGLWSKGYGESLPKPGADLNRRVNDIKQLIKSHALEIQSILDFGCGNGEMLRSLAPDFQVYGLDPDDKAREVASSGGMVVYKDIQEIIDEGKKFDLVTLFHVVEHFYEPDEELKSISKILNKGGILIIETPNSQDALLTWYKNSSFQNYTYWSHHPMLHSHDSLAELVERNDFKVLENEGIQRYGLENHLYWLSNGKPNGHEIWKNFLTESTLKDYEKDLVGKRICDTLWMVTQWST